MNSCIRRIRSRVLEIVFWERGRRQIPGVRWFGNWRKGNGGIKLGNKSACDVHLDGHGFQSKLCVFAFYSWMLVVVRAAMN